jgi:hypothetical protein
VTYFIGPSIMRETFHSGCCPFSPVLLGPRNFQAIRHG